MAVPVVTWEQYAADWSGLHGGVDLGKVRPGVRRWLRLGFVISRWLQRARVPAGAVTALGLLSSIFVAVVVTHGSGGILLAAVLVFVATLADTVDGALAVLSGHTTRLGYVYDAVVDRIGEACWLIALWRIGVAGHVVVAAGALAWLHEYVRSRGNAAGMTEITAVTVGERPTRIMVTIGGLVLAGLAESFNPHVAAGIAALTAATWIVLGLIGIVQLLAAVHRALAGRSWPTWRPASAPSATTLTPSAPPAPTPASGVRAATPAYPGPFSAAGRPDGSFNDESGDRSYERASDVADERRTPDVPSTDPGSDGEVGASDRIVRDSGISEVVGYAAPSADEPSDLSSDLALREPTLDDLLGDAGARVRSAVGKYGRSVTVYRSQAARTPEVDAGTTSAYDGTDATDAPDFSGATDAGYATEETGATGAEGIGTEGIGTEAMDTANDAEVRSARGAPTKDGAGGGTGSHGGTGAGISTDRTGTAGANAEHATVTKPDRPSQAESGESASGPSRASKIRAHSRARIRFSRRSRGGTARSMADKAGDGPGPAASAGSDHSGDG